MKFSVSVTGGDIRVDADISEALASAAERVRAAAQSMCPVDTGRLKNSLSCYSDGFTAAVFTDVEYAPYVEFGTSKAAAQPFMAPALIMAEDEIAEAMLGSITRGGGN